MPDQGQCRSCGAPVIWAAHERTRKLAPMEQDDAGAWTIVGGTYFKPARVEAELSEAKVERDRLREGLAAAEDGIEGGDLDYALTAIRAALSPRAPEEVGDGE